MLLGEWRQDNTFSIYIDIKNNLATESARLSSKRLLGQRYIKGRLKSSLRTFYGRYVYGDRIKDYEVCLSQMLQDILRHTNIQ